jgi:carbonic anhydrase
VLNDGKRLAVLTCMDARLDPLAMLGVEPGQVPVLRNAGARVTDDVLRSLIVATHVLGVERVLVIAHTDCRMAGQTEDELRAAIAAAGGPVTADELGAMPDQEAALRADVERLRTTPQLDRLEVEGFLYDVQTGRLAQLV